MKFNLRLMMVWTGILCFLLFVFRVPMVYFIDSYMDGDKCYQLACIAMNPFRHLGYIFGYETEYLEPEVNNRHVNFLEFLIFVCAPYFVSFLLHIVIISCFICICEKLHNWAKE